MATPNAMPKKANPLHQQILSALLGNKQTVRTEIRSRFDKKTQSHLDHKIEVPVPTLAGHVSDENVNRMARRWIA